MPQLQNQNSEQKKTVSINSQISENSALKNLAQDHHVTISLPSKDFDKTTDTLENKALNKSKTPFVQRTLARGFTITVSPPSDLISQNVEKTSEMDLSPTHYTHELQNFSDLHSSTSEFTDFDELLPRKSLVKHTDDYLAPEENIPQVTLDRTLSRLPSLEDMLADEELNKLLNTSAIHRELQDMILVEDEHKKYINIMSLVEKSFKNAEWRVEAAEDKRLIDTLVLLSRQRLASSKNPQEPPGSDFMPKSTKHMTSLTSKSTFSRSATSTSTDWVTQNCHLGSCSLNDCECLIRSAKHLAIVSATTKLLRNLCVQSKTCQLYLHEHRLIDLLFDYIEVIMNIVYRSQDVINSEKFAQEDLASTTWAFTEAEQFPRALIQLTTNVLSKNSKIQNHILDHIFPDCYTYLIFLSGDADLLFCLLHSLTVQLDTNILISTIITGDNIKILYLLLAYAAMLLKTGKTQFSQTISAENPQPLEWAVSFFTSLLRRTWDDASIFFLFLTELIKFDPMKHTTMNSNKIFTRAASTKMQNLNYSMSGSLNISRSSGDILSDSLNLMDKKLQSILDIPKELIIEAYIDLVIVSIELNDLLRKLEKNQIENTITTQILQNPKNLETLTEIISAGLYELDWIHPEKDSASLCKKIAPSIFKFALKISTIPIIINDTSMKYNFFKLPQLKLCIAILKKELSLNVTTQEILLMVANLCHLNPDAQEYVNNSNALQVILTHCHTDFHEPFKREAAVLALKYVCLNSEKNQKALNNLISNETFTGRNQLYDDIVNSCKQ